MTSPDRTPHPADPAEGAREDDPHDSPQAQRETLRGEPGTSSGEPPGDTGPRQG